MDILTYLQEQARYYRCPKCAESLEACSINVLNSVSNIYTVRVTCSHCAVTFVIVITVQPGGVPARQLASHAAGAARPPLREAAPSAPAEPIASDELLDLHEGLARWSGDLTDLLEPRGRE